MHSSPKSAEWRDSLSDKLMSKKPSFLERLTGVLEEEEENERKISSPPADDDDRDDDDEENEEEDEKSEEKPKNKKIKKIIQPSEEKKEEKRASQDWLPDSEGQLTIDVYQTPSEIVIKSTIAGVDPADLDITITNDMVTIKGKREKDEVISEGDYYYQECYWGAFSRSVILPVDVEAEKAEAAMKNGILTIKLPKIEKIKTKKIKVLG